MPANCMRSLLTLIPLLRLTACAPLEVKSDIISDYRLTYDNTVYTKMPAIVLPRAAASSPYINTTTPFLSTSSTISSTIPSSYSMADSSLLSDTTIAANGTVYELTENTEGAEGAEGAESTSTTTSTTASTTASTTTSIPTSIITSTTNSTTNSTTTSTTTSTTASTTTSTTTSTAFSTTTSTTINTTFSTSTTDQGNGSLTLYLENNLDSKTVYAYLTGFVNGQLAFLGPDDSWVLLTNSSDTPVSITSPIAIPLGQPNSTTSMTIPGFIGSARLYVSNGTLPFETVGTSLGIGLVQPAVVNPNDPSEDINYSFIEFDWANASGQYQWYGDISYVDFVGLPLGLELTDSQNNTQSVLGTPPDAAPRLCNNLKAQALSDNQPWDELCVYDTNDNLIRVLSPSSFNSSAFDAYFAPYVAQVWEHYSSTNLIFQLTSGNVSCRVSGTELQCDNDGGSFAQPNASDILGCNSGPFAIAANDTGTHKSIVPILCAAINRGDLLLPGGNQQPSQPQSVYYDGTVCNQYSRWVHAMEWKGRGYAFPYDDVSSNFQDNAAGLITSTSPTSMKVIVGGYSKSPPGQ